MKYPPVHVYTHSGERGRPVGRPVVAEYIDDVRYVRPSTAVIAYMTNDTRSPGQTPPPPPGVCPGERVPVRRRVQLSDLARGVHQADRRTERIVPAARRGPAFGRLPTAEKNLSATLSSSSQVLGGANILEAPSGRGNGRRRNDCGTRW